MNLSKAPQVIADALARLRADLEAETSESLKRYLTMMGRFHHYSLGNIFLIFAQRPEATRVAGFRTWKSLGRYVKQGEKGIMILAPMLCRTKPTSEETRREPEEEDKIVQFRAVYVFDISQTDGEALPEFERPTGDPGQAMERLRSFVESRGIALAYSKLLGSADGVSTGGKILLRPGMAPAEEFSVLVHEMAHEILHQHDGQMGPPGAVRETEAEAVAFTVSTAVGLEPRRSSSDYIVLHRGKPETLAASLERIQKTAAEVLDALLGVEVTTQGSEVIG